MSTELTTQSRSAAAVQYDSGASGRRMFLNFVLMAELMSDYQTCPSAPPTQLGTRPGFVTDSFNALRLVYPFEWRVGAVFSADPAKHLHRSLSEISQLIRLVAAKYLRWPASDQPSSKSNRFAAQTPRRLSRSTRCSSGKLASNISKIAELTRPLNGRDVRTLAVDGRGSRTIDGNRAEAELR